MKPIEFPDKYGIVMSKPVWSEQELALARCYNFVISGDSESVSIIVDIRKTAKIAVINFLALSFRAMWESVMRKYEKDQIMNKIDEMYVVMNNAREVIAKERLPYWDKLYAHQKESIILAMGRKHNLLAFEQRLGKSITAASLSRIHAARRTLVICIPVAKWGWQEDLCENFGYNPLYFSILDTKKSKTVKALSPFHERFVITHYEALPKHKEYLLARPIDRIIIDECQNIKNINTNRYKNIQEIVDANPEIKNIVNANPGISISLLSGTPIKNRVDDLFAYFKLTGHEMGKNRAKFLREFAQMKTGRNIERCVGARNIDQLVVNMANFMIRKTEEQCFDMPEITYIKTMMELDDYREEYDRIMLEMIQNHDKGAINGHLISVNRVLAMSKVKSAIELIDELVENGKKVVVFTSYTDPINMLEKHYGNRCVKIDGTVDHSERFIRIKRFKTDPDCPIILGNTIALGSSMNLSEANDTIFLNYTFTSTEIAQCVARMKMPNKKSKMGVYFITCKDTIDEILYELVGSKQSEINQIIDGGKGIDYAGDIKDVLYKRILSKTNSF